MSHLNRIGIPQNEMEKIVETLRSFSGVRKASLFGSRAKGNYREGSDIDIALIAPSMTHNEYLRLCTALDELLLPYKIDLILMHQIDNADLQDHIRRVGIELF